jgi:MFS transporter, MHS family, shikimate and dehydroshikimate transport protein
VHSVASASRQTELRRVVLASFVGTTIEWYDFFLYGTASALVFNRLFFPSLDPLAGTLSAYATFAVGFVARPVGGAIFGHFGDRLGRKAMLIWSLAIMGVATALVGMLPTYERIGAWAPALLFVLRFAASGKLARSSLPPRSSRGWKRSLLDHERVHEGDCVPTAEPPARG